MLLQDEQMLLRYVNNYHRSVYAFEMLPAPNVSQPEVAAHVTSAATSDHKHTATTATAVVDNEAVSASANDDCRDIADDVLNNFVANGGVLIAAAAPAALEHRTDVNWQSNMLTTAADTAALQEATAEPAGRAGAIDVGGDVGGDASGDAGGDASHEAMDAVSEAKTGTELVRLFKFHVYAIFCPFLFSLNI